MVIAGADDHRIEIFLIEHRPVVSKDPPVSLPRRHGRSHLPVVGIADRRHTAGGGDIAQQLHAPLAHADDAQHDLFVGSRRAGQAKHMARNEQRRGGRKCRDGPDTQEFAACGLSRFLHRWLSLWQARSAVALSSRSIPSTFLAVAYRVERIGFQPVAVFEAKLGQPPTKYCRLSHKKRQPSEVISRPKNSG